ncbi:MAG: SIMPL domain-containing protein [Bdellovibrionota bacterium]
MKLSLVIAAGLLSLSSVSARAEQPPRTISVTGTCTKTVTFDRGAIIVTADVLDPDLQKATKRATDTYEAVRAAVQKLNLKDSQLMTNEYSVTEQKEWEKERAVSKGFRARMGLQVTTSEISRLGEVIAIAAKQSVRDVSALNSFLSADKEKTERESCLEAAVQNAQAKAARMAKIAGAKLGRVQQLLEEGAQAPEPISQRPMQMEAKSSYVSKMADSGPGVEAGAGRLRVNVNATFAIE